MSTASCIPYSREEELSARRAADANNRKARIVEVRRQERELAAAHRHGARRRAAAQRAAQARRSREEVSRAARREAK